jgi:predicted ester cyclase
MKKNLTMLLLAACVLAACKQTGLQSEKNRQAALAAMQAFNKADLTQMKRLCGQGFVDYESGEDKPSHNLDSMKVSMDAFNAAFADMKVTNLQMFLSGDTVIITNMRSGTFKYPLMGIKPNGKSFNYPDADILVFNKDGLIISHRAIQSNMTIFAQLGIAPPGN